MSRRAEGSVPPPVVRGPLSLRRPHAMCPPPPLTVPAPGLALCLVAGCGSASSPGGGPGRIFREAENAGKKAVPEQAAEAPARKIIYTARVEMVSEAFDKAEDDLLALVKERGGYVAKAE